MRHGAFWPPPLIGLCLVGPQLCLAVYGKYRCRLLDCFTPSVVLFIILLYLWNTLLVGAKVPVAPRCIRVWSLSTTLSVYLSGKKRRVTRCVSFVLFRKSRYLKSLFASRYQQSILGSSWYGWFGGMTRLVRKILYPPTSHLPGTPINSSGCLVHTYCASIPWRFKRQRVLYLHTYVCLCHHTFCLQFPGTNKCVVHAFREGK